MKYKMVQPKPYLEVDCGGFRNLNRTKNKIQNILTEISYENTNEIYDKFFLERCDYEGDMDTIILYNNESLSQQIIKNIFSEFNIEINNLPENTDIHFKA